jgi:hypothetical protein
MFIGVDKRIISNWILQSVYMMAGTECFSLMIGFISGFVLKRTQVP